MKNSATQISVKLSICIPTFNRVDCLDAALKSIAENLQGQNSAEVVVSDNNSSDATECIVKYYQEQLPILYHKNSANIGGIKNLVKAISLAKGEYVWLFSDDDIMISGSVKYLLDFLANHKDIEYVFFPRALVTKDLQSTIHVVQPIAVMSDTIFPDGKSLFISCDGQMPSILGFFSSTIIRRNLWAENIKKPNVSLSNTWAHLITILNAILDKKCAILGKVGVLCRLQNPTVFSVNSKVWFDDYIRCFLLAMELGYSQELCSASIRRIIRSFSKGFVVDKAKGLRTDNILACLSELHCKDLTVKSFPWFYFSFLPSKILNLAFRTFIWGRKRII